MRFTDRVAIVTGGGSGIGRAVAVQLAREGARVVVLDIDEPTARVTVEQITVAGGLAQWVIADVGDERAVEAAFDAVEARYGVASVVVNCAGVLHVSPALETAVDEFDRVIRINLRSVFLVSTAAARRLRSAARGGSIVNVSSIHAVLSEPNASAYTAAKGGLEAISRTFASEWATLGIRVNCVRPGATITALTERLYTPAVLAGLAHRIPMGSPAQPHQVAAGICFLASDEADYCTGTTLDIDGGYVMHGGLPDVEYR
jgi:NAD(P)-dependent dehydrogenase (short-subunit alcohol dehydrogenase family)